MSNTTSLMSSLARMTGMGVDRVLIFGNSLCDHDHPIPRLLYMRSRASRRTFGMDKGRSTGAPCWPSRGELYLLSGLLENVQAMDSKRYRSSQTGQFQASAEKKTKIGDKIAPQTSCSSY